MVSGFLHPCCTYVARRNRGELGMKGRPGGWEDGLLVAHLLPTGHVAAYSVPLVGGAFTWGGKVYC